MVEVIASEEGSDAANAKTRASFRQLFPLRFWQEKA